MPGRIPPRPTHAPGAAPHPHRADGTTPGEGRAAYPGEPHAPFSAAPGTAPAPGETTVRLRPVPPDPGFATHHHHAWPPPPPPPRESLSETTTHLRPVPSRPPVRAAAAVACVVLGLGLIGGAVTGSWLTGDSAAEPVVPDAYTTARALWHSVPVDTLFPRTLKGDGAGPGRADRAWTRVAVAPDGTCADALPAALVRTLRPVGCTRVLRATYADSTGSSLTTVGLVFTEGDRPAMTALKSRLITRRLAERTDHIPHTFSVEGTPTAGFGERQRASWTLEVVDGVPVVGYAVSGFADGRTVTDPQPASAATVTGATTAAAEAGLGFEAKGIATRIEEGLRRAATTTAMAAPR
ncbi:hypothetical protein [Streptomyces sp. NPDC088261]|uniref:hypothetical protein n=1 Tax=Streptomyces sp. NPDC088261 TaxID=3365851 RepID=UPI0037FD1E97